MSKQLKIALINDVHVGPPLERNNHVRASSHLVEQHLPLLLEHIENKHAPDILINLGDLIRSETSVADLRRYEDTLAHFKRVKCKTVHLVGNHDIKRLNVEDIEHLWQKQGFLQKSYGKIEIGGCVLVWLGMECRRERLYKHHLPDTQLEWLEEVLQSTQKPVLIFTHCALDEQDVSGNFFYEGYEEKNTYGFFLENFRELQSVISRRSSVILVVQAHLHYFHSKMIAHVPYLTCPAMGDNICGPHASEHIPEIYSLLTVNMERIVFKSYARDYCFAGAEFTVNLP